MPSSLVDDGVVLHNCEENRQTRITIIGDLDTHTGLSQTGYCGGYMRSGSVRCGFGRPAPCASGEEG